MICVYKILNLVNNKFYIGSTLNFSKRKITHLRLLRKNKHHSTYLQNAFNKYGESNFKFVILKKTDSIKLRKYEQKYLNKLNPSYNISKSAYAPMEGRVHSKETLKKLKARPVIKGKKHYLYGKKVKRSIVEKQLKSRSGYRHSEETKNKMKKTAIKINAWLRLKESIQNSKKEIVDSNGYIYLSIKDAAKKHKIHVSTVCDILNGRHKKTRTGVSFEYL